MRESEKLGRQRGSSIRGLVFVAALGVGLALLLLAAYAALPYAGPASSTCPPIPECSCPATTAASALLEQKPSGAADGADASANIAAGAGSPGSTGTGSASSPVVPPTFSKCTLEIVGGRASDGYGAWPLCTDHVPAKAIIYSFGIGGDISFDIAMIRRGAHVFAYDPTVSPEHTVRLFAVAKASELNTSMTFMQVGLGSTNGVIPFFRSRKESIGSMTSVGAKDVRWWEYKNSGFQAPVLTLPTLMAAHKHAYIDLLKVDVEGVEFDVCDTEEFLDSLDHVGQVIYEFHTRLLKKPKGRKERCVQALAQKGFRLLMRTKGEEYVFARVTPDAVIDNRTPPDVRLAI